jgi:hypothetical protein
VLVGDACFRPLIIIRSHDLHVDNIRKVMGEITSNTTKGINFLFSLVIVGCIFFGLSLAFHYIFCVMVSAI